MINLSIISCVVEFWKLVFWSIDPHRRYWRATESGSRARSRSLGSRRWVPPLPLYTRDQRPHTGPWSRGSRGPDPASAPGAGPPSGPRAPEPSPEPGEAPQREPEPGRSLATPRWWWPALYRSPNPHPHPNPNQDQRSSLTSWSWLLVLEQRERVRALMNICVWVWRYRLDTPPEERRRALCVGTTIKESVLSGWIY